MLLDILFCLQVALSALCCWPQNTRAHNTQFVHDLKPMHITCDTVLIGHAVAKNLLFFTSSTVLCACFNVSQLWCTQCRSHGTSLQLASHAVYIVIPAGFSAAGTCGDQNRDITPERCDGTQANQIWLLWNQATRSSEPVCCSENHQNWLLRRCKSCSSSKPLTYFD